MKSRIYTSSFLFIMLFAVFSCTEGFEDEVKSLDEKELVSVKEIQSMVEQKLERGESFDWKESSIEVLYSAGMHADSVFSIGYNVSSSFDVRKQIHLIDVETDAWVEAREVIESIIIKMESEFRGLDVVMSDLEPFGKVEYFPQILIQTSNIELLERLRGHELVRYVEPIGFSITDLTIAQRSSSGCDGDPDYNINPLDYTSVIPNSKVPWNFYTHKIDQAWDATTKGDNVKVCIIDTGASDSQDNLGSQFNSGNSNGRTIEKYSTKYSGSWWWRSLDSPNDPCGHGTSMAGNASAPWSNDGNALGAAYQSNLMTIRAVEDVVISTSNERNGVRDALYLSGNSNTKIISMSIGTPFYSSTVADGIFFAYNKGKLLLAAAGTSLPWTSWYPVIFPANMTQTVAITGVQDGESLVKCETCHSGPEVDFVIVMERETNTDRHSLSLARYSNQPKYIGGSSTATATTAGIAAIVWGQDLSATRTEIMNALKSSASIYPQRDDDFGWGMIDASVAVSGL